MMIYSGCGVRLARFCRAEIRAGCCPGFRASGFIFMCSSSRVLSVAIAVYISECGISITSLSYDVINDVSTFISYPCRIFAVMFIIWPS